MPTFVTIRTIDMRNGEMHDERCISFDNRRQTNWLMKHMTWAVNNGFGIQTFNVNDKEPG